MPNDLEPRVTALEAAMVELAQAQAQAEARHARLGQRLDEFIHQSARLLGDHGSRLNRIEAGLESLLALAKASDRRLNRVDAQIEALTEAALNHEQRLDRLTAIVETNEQRFAQLEVSQSQVLSRMDDVIAVLRERL